MIDTIFLSIFIIRSGLLFFSTEAFTEISKLLQDLPCKEETQEKSCNSIEHPAIFIAVSFAINRLA